MRKNFSKLFSIYVLVLLFSVVFVKSQDAYAAPTGSIKALEFNKSVSVTKSVQEKEYWYKITLKAGQGVDFNMNATLNTGSMYLELYDDKDNYIDRISYIYNGNNDTLHFQSSLNATYYIKVSGDGLGTFKLGTYNSWYNYNNDDSKRPFNSTMYTAKCISSGVKVLSNGASYYRFVANKGSKLSITTRAESVDNYINLKLFDVKGNEIDSENYIYTGESGTISYSVPLTTVYYVGVFGQGKYSLTYSGTSKQTDSDGDKLMDDQEYYGEYYVGYSPNKKDSDGDGVDDYIELSKGKSPVAKYEYTESSLQNHSSMSTALELKKFDSNYIFETSGQQGTWYKFKLGAKESITLVGDADLNINSINIRIYNSEGTELNAVNLDSGYYNTFSISSNINNTYYIYVDGDGIGEYRIGLNHNWNSVGMSDSKRIFNSTFDTATYIKSGYQKLSYYYEDTYYRFKAIAGKNFIIDFTPSSTSDYVNMTLYDQYGNNLVDRRYLSNGDNGNINYKPALSGYYYLRISGHVREGNLTYTGIIAEGDVTPPTMKSVSPKNNSTNVAINSSVTLTFTENVKAGTNYSKMALRTLVNGKYETVPSNITIKNNTLTIKPKASLGYGKTYNVYIPKAALKDAAGNLTKSNIVSNFTTIKQVVIKDKNLEKAIRNAINKQKGAITSVDMLSLKQLCASYVGVKDLTGLEYAVNLQRLILNNNSITSITQLTNLTNLTHLDLSNNNITSIKPLEKLTKLSTLHLYNNSITSISSLKTNRSNGGFSNLGYIDLRKNKMDVSKTSQAYKDIQYLKSKSVYLVY